MAVQKHVAWRIVLALGVSAGCNHPTPTPPMELRCEVNGAGTELLVRATLPEGSIANLSLRPSDSLATETFKPVPMSTQSPASPTDYVAKLPLNGFNDYQVHVTAKPPAHADVTLACPVSNNAYALLDPIQESSGSDPFDLTTAMFKVTRTGTRGYKQTGVGLKYRSSEGQFVSRWKTPDPRSVVTEGGKALAVSATGEFPIAWTMPPPTTSTVTIKTPDGSKVEFAVELQSLDPWNNAGNLVDWESVTQGFAWAAPHTQNSAEVLVVFGQWKPVGDATESPVPPDRRRKKWTVLWAPPVRDLHAVELVGLLVNQDTKGPLCDYVPENPLSGATGATLPSFGTRLTLDIYEARSGKRLWQRIVELPPVPCVSRTFVGDTVASRPNNDSAMRSLEAWVAGHGMRVHLDHLDLH